MKIYPTPDGPLSPIHWLLGLVGLLSFMTPSRKDRWRPEVHFHVQQSHSIRPKGVVISLSPPFSPPLKAEKQPRPSSSSSSIDFNELLEESTDSLNEYIRWQIKRSPKDTTDLFGALDVKGGVRMMEIRWMNSDVNRPSGIDEGRRRR